MTTPTFDRRRFLGGAAALGAAAVLAPAGVVTLRSTARPGSADVVHAGALPHVHRPRPILPAPHYVTVVETRTTPGGVPYRAAVARPAPPRRTT